MCMLSYAYGRLYLCGTQCMVCCVYKPAYFNVHVIKCMYLCSPPKCIEKTHEVFGRCIYGLNPSLYF